MQKTFLLFGALLAGLGVAFGAFGAHGLKKIVTPENVATFQTGVQYQIYHALALLLLGVLADRIFNSFLTSSGFLFLGGILFFSGSLYLITALQAMDKLVPTALRIVTPIGGLLFILGWIVLFIGILKK